MEIQPPAKIVDRSRLVRSRPRSLDERRAAPYGAGAAKPRPLHAIDKPATKTYSMQQLEQAYQRTVKPQPFAAPAKPKQETSRVLKRQFARAAKPVDAHPSRLNIKTKRSKMQVALVVMAVAVFGLGMLVNIQTVQTNHNAKAQVAALSKSSNDDSGSKPSETKPASSNYAVAPNMPKYLKIAKLGINARVLALGVTSDNQLKAPTNIYDTGWYNASAHPGDAASNGAILIDGHVHGPTLPGVFSAINTLTAGDTIQIVRGDNKIFNYAVVKTQSYDADKMDMSLGLISAQPGQPGLNLITCSGKYDRKSGEYNQRMLVSAVQIP